MSDQGYGEALPAQQECESELQVDVLRSPRHRLRSASVKLVALRD